MNELPLRERTEDLEDQMLPSAELLSQHPGRLSQLSSPESRVAGILQLC